MTLAKSGLVVCASLVLTVSGVLAQSDAVRTAIENADKRFGEAAKKGDAAAIAKIYAVDAEAFPPNGDVVKGRMAIQQMWKSVLDSGVAGLDATTRQVETVGSLAIESGTYVITMKDGKVADRGKYNVVWKRVAGQWQLYRDIWNTSMPAPGAK
jgi:uncharacterized protein (TIGR02246 family)